MLNIGHVIAMMTRRKDVRWVLGQHERGHGLEGTGTSKGLWGRVYWWGAGDITRSLSYFDPLGDDHIRGCI